MLTRVSLALLVFALTVTAQTKRILYITHSAGFVHGSITVSKRALDDIARRTGKFEVFSTEDLSFLSADRLRDFDAAFFFTSGELPITDAQKRDLLDFVRSGKGFGGAHSATDTLYQWAEYGELIGGYFDGHPWVHEAAIDVEDPDHPVTRTLGRSFRILEEFYQFRSFSRDRVRVLMTLDPQTINLKAEGVNRTDGDFALAWVRPYGEGRVFYTALGHFDETWLDPRFQRMIEGGLLWMVREVDGDAAPRKSSPLVRRVSNLAYDTDGVAAPGLLVSITGSGLTSGSRMDAGTLPLPSKLVGTELRVNDKLVGLISVAPDRVVAQLPADLKPGEPTALHVVAGGITPSLPQAIRVDDTAPGIFGVIRIANMVSLWVTGLGSATDVEITVGGRAAQIAFRSAVPDLAGLTQIIAILPPDPSGEIRVKAGGRESNAHPLVSALAGTQP